MFSSNQKFIISGELTDLEPTLKFAMELYEPGSSTLCFQITEDGRYCIGYGCQEGWTKFQFDFDYHIIAEIIKQHFNKLPKTKSKYDSYDGSTYKGFIMKAIPETFADKEDGIVNPFFGIISIGPYECFYSK